MKPSEKALSKTGAGVAGAGGGTLLILLARNLPDSNPLKSWFIIIAPSATVFVSAVWLWLRHGLSQYAARRETIRLISEAKATLARGINSSITSQEHRDRLRQKYEELELLQVAGFSQRLRILDSNSDDANGPTS